MNTTAMGVPDHFCWTRFGVEAGESSESILNRKERERVANRGIFLWGIGNAVGGSMRELLRTGTKPEVLFSPIKSPPRLADSAPPATAAWTWGVTLDGDPFRIPEHSLVTSRYDPARPRNEHFALVCQSYEVLTRSSRKEELLISELRNLVSGRPVGASQVTAVVRREHLEPLKQTRYQVIIRAELVYPYFLRLRGPVMLDKSADNWIEEGLRFVQQHAIALPAHQSSFTAKSSG
jgi:hypothetical protein